MLSIVVPCYNERDNIPHIIAKFEAAIPEGVAVEILLVNNGSTDDSAAVFSRELAKTGAPIRMVDVPVNRGYGFGITSGLAEAKGEVLAWTHADLQTDPADVFRGYAVHRRFPEAVVKGVRKKRRMAEAFLTFGMEVVASLALRCWLRDINAQPKVFPRAFYERHVRQDAPLDFSLDLYLLYQAKRHAEIRGFPVYFTKRLYGEAKGGGSFRTRVKLIKRTFSYIFALARREKRAR